MIFPYTFEGKALNLYVSLPKSSITSWNHFQTAFLDKFGEDKTPTVLVLELSRIRMDDNEKVKDLNQRFLSLINKILAKYRPTKGVVIEFYTSAFSQTMAMFVKQDQKTTLQGNFAEAIRVETNLVSLKVNEGNDKPSTSRTPIKTHTDRRGQDAFDIEGLQRMVKQLFNEIIDLKKNSGESTLGRGFFRFLDKKHFSPIQPPPPENINIPDYAMDNFCQAHKDIHSEKNCLAFINMFELFTMSQINPPPSEENRNT